MGVACPNCGNEDLRVDPISRFNLGIPHLRDLNQAVVILSCRPCRSSYQFYIQGQNRPSFSHFVHVLDNDKPSTETITRGYISLMPSPGSMEAVVGYNFAATEEQSVLWPIQEASIQSGEVVDQFGDPDLMADFAKEYLKQHRVLLRTGRFPQSLVEVMPSLLLLVTAAELVMKAFTLRSKDNQPRTHDLVELYDGLDPKHQAAIESRFGKCELVVGLTSIGIDAPKIQHILGRYADIYGGKRGVYQEAKFYAEPTTMLPKGSNATGESLVKGNTPYPTFMPYLVEAIVDCYYHYTGRERLRRRGAEVHEASRVSDSHGHGEWAMRPSSLGLAVIVVSQDQSKDSKRKELPSFTDFKALHPTDFQADWMYGGSTFLFYDAMGRELRDGIETIAGVECRVISEELVRMHSRDLDRLADIFEAIDAGDISLGSLPPAL